METSEPVRPLHSVDHEEAAATGDVVEIRAVEQLRFCSSCLVSNASSDKFCSACGAELPSTTEPGELPDADIEQTAVTAAEDVLHAPVHGFADEAPTVMKHPGQSLRGWQFPGAGLLLALAVAGLATFAALWQSQSNHATRLQRSLAKTSTELASTKATLLTTQAQLFSARSLSDKRRAVLVQAADVVAKVDPLLSSVDNIQGKAQTMSSLGSGLSGDAETFISTVAGLVNYLYRSEGGYVDYAWVNQQIDNANTQLNTLRYDESMFSTGDTAYGDASKAFGVKADAFSVSVRRLQKQLKDVTAK
jgi:hypothetical protein